MAWFLFLPWPEWIKRVTKFRQVHHRSAEQTWSTINLLLPIHTPFTTKEKTPASIVSWHAKILLGLSCISSPQLRIWSKWKAFLSISCWIKNEVRDLCHWLHRRPLWHGESLNSRLHLNKSAHRYHCMIIAHHSIVLRGSQSSLFYFWNMLEREASGDLNMSPVSLIF